MNYISATLNYMGCMLGRPIVVGGGASFEVEVK